MATMNLFLCLPELLVSLVLGPVVAAAGDSMRVPMLVGAVACLAAAALVHRFMVMPPPQARLPLGSRVRSTAANGGGSGGGGGGESELAQSELDPQTWKDKADEVPAWVAPAGAQRPDERLP